MHFLLPRSSFQLHVHVGHVWFQSVGNPQSSVCQHENPSYSGCLSAKKNHVHPLSSLDGFRTHRHDERSAWCVPYAFLQKFISDGMHASIWPGVTFSHDLQVSGPWAEKVKSVRKRELLNLIQHLCTPAYPMLCHVTTGAPGVMFVTCCDIWFIAGTLRRRNGSNPDQIQVLADAGRA
jgi:hypothetical protein